MPTASISYLASSSATAPAMTPTVSSGLAAGVNRLTFSKIWPRSSTTPAATFVPPTSTPIVRLMRRSVWLPARGARCVLVGYLTPRVVLLRRRGPSGAVSRCLVRRGYRFGCAGCALIPRRIASNGVVLTLRPRRLAALAGTTRLGQHSVQQLDRILHGGSDCVASAGNMPSQAGTRITHSAGCPADRAPLALRCLADFRRDLASGLVPDI